MNKIYHKVNIKDIINFYIKGFDDKISNYEFNYDPNKKEVIFELYIEGNNPAKPNKNVKIPEYDKLSEGCDPKKCHE